jgi:hypothetical protein
MITYTMMLPQTEREEQLIAYGKEVGKAQELLRIIKVLQDKIKWQKRNGSVDDDMDMGILIGLDTAIEIAKGKDNDQ